MRVCVSGSPTVLIVHFVRALAGRRASVRRTSRGTPGGLLMYRIGSPRGAERDARVFAGQKSGRPQPGRDRLHLLGVGGLGDQHDERRQVLVERAEAVGRPRPEARPAGDLVAGLHERDGRLVIDGFGVHAADEAHVVDHLRRVHGSSSLTHMPHLAVLREFVFRRRDRESGPGPLVIVVSRWPIADRFGQVLVVPVVHLRLVVEQIHLRRARRPCADR